MGERGSGEWRGTESKEVKGSAEEMGSKAHCRWRDDE